MFVMRRSLKSVWLESSWLKEQLLNSLHINFAFEEAKHYLSLLLNH